MQLQEVWGLCRGLCYCPQTYLCGLITSHSLVGHDKSCRDKSSSDISSMQSVRSIEPQKSCRNHLSRQGLSRQEASVLSYSHQTLRSDPLIWTSCLSGHRFLIDRLDLIRLKCIWFRLGCFQFQVCGQLSFNLAANQLAIFQEVLTQGTN